jgi:hypothetical protein
MDDSIRAALGRNQVIEIYLHSFDGRLVISGKPFPGRTRAWIHNLAADPALTIHLKNGGVVADVAGTARVVTDPAERRALVERVARSWGRTDVDVMVEHSPLIEVTVPGYPA